MFTNIPSPSNHPIRALLPVWHTLPKYTDLYLCALGVVESHLTHTHAHHNKPIERAPSAAQSSHHHQANTHTRSTIDRRARPSAAAAAASAASSSRVIEHKTLAIDHRPTCGEPSCMPRMRLCADHQTHQNARNWRKARARAAPRLKRTRSNRRTRVIRAHARTSDARCWAPTSARAVVTVSGLASVVEQH